MPASLRLAVGLALVVLLAGAVPMADAHPLGRPAPAATSTPSPALVPQTPSAPVATPLTPSSGLDARAATWTAAPVLPGVPWTVLAGALAVLAAGVLRPRSAIAVLLVAVVSVFAFESPLHSVHHIGDPTSGCAVAGVSGHLSGVTVEYVSVDLHAVASSDRVDPVGAENIPLRSPRPFGGRAPPTPLA